jgi:hypothetical protein
LFRVVRFAFSESLSSLLLLQATERNRQQSRKRGLITAAKKIAFHAPVAAAAARGRVGCNKMNLTEEEEEEKKTR